jgi:hypothetical protein
MHIKFWAEDLKGWDYFRNNHKWDENIIMDLRETGCDGVE